MVVSDRCRGVNLLNHLKQLKKPVSVNFIQIKDISDRKKLVEKIINIDDFKSKHPNWIEYLNKLLWVCTLTIDSGIFLALGEKKKDVLNYLLREKHDELTLVKNSENN